MAMTLPIAIPSTPTSGNSPASDDSNPPRTPVSPTISALPDQSTTNSNNNNNNSQMKRKPSRRANTAERRATHNAVERQRRETLNGRFLDLAALLPNLSQIRRPSKSSIVNSSIAHVHASRRHRQLAARELRLVKVEADALRRELNEWRDRAGLPRVEEPVRGEGFSMVLSGELEVLAAVPGEEDDEDNIPGYANYDDIDDDFANNSNPEVDDPRVAAAKNPFAHNPPPGLHLAHILPRPTQGPMIASPTSVSFENPAMHSLYEPHQQFPPNPHFQQSLSMGQPDADKIAAWNAAHMYPGATTQQILHAQRSLFTPPSTSHGLSSANNANFNDPAGQAFFANFQRQQQQQQQLSAMHHQMGGATHYGSDRDDASSVGSGRGGRARSGSGSGYGGSPQHGSSPYEMPASGDYNSNIRRASWDDMGGLMKSNQIPPPISVGGGGNGTGFQMMM